MWPCLKEGHSHTDAMPPLPDATPTHGPGPLEDLLKAAEDQLWADFEKTKVFSHKGVAGSGREGAVAKFLRAHLPERFSIASGQAVDAGHRLSGQLDLILYDQHLSTPLLKGADGADLLPAEALLAAVEGYQPTRKKPKAKRAPSARKGRTKRGSSQATTRRRSRPKRKHGRPPVRWR